MQVYAPSPRVMDDEEESKDEPAGMFNECDFNISPSRVPKESLLPE